MRLTAFCPLSLRERERERENRLNSAPCYDLTPPPLSEGEGLNI
jgi:hypothetical protein